MHPSNNKNRIDRFKESVENALGMKAKKTKEMAATTGFATIYGLLFASLLFAPLPLPSGKVQVQCSEFDPNDCANPCYVESPFENEEFHDANSREDCDRILQKVLKDIEDQGNALEAAYDAAKKCDTTYDEELKTNDLQHRLNTARAANTASEIFWECMGLGGGAAGGTASGAWVIKTIKGATVTVTRFGSAAGFTLVVGIGTYKICKDMRMNTAQNEVDAANNLEKNADGLALKKRERCREDTNYDAAIRDHLLWDGMYDTRRVDRRGRLIFSMWQRLTNKARADHRKCLEQFPVGDCGTTE